MSNVAYADPCRDGAEADIPRGSATPGPSRPSWSGLLHIGLLAVPVKAYPAILSAPQLPTHLLHASCGQRIRYDKRCPCHGTLEAGAIVKGYEHAPGQFLVLDEAELDRLRPVRDRALTLDTFLDPARIDPLLFSGRSLYLTPAGIAAQAAYAVLAHALAERQQAALGRVVLSSRRHLVLLRPRGTLLILHLLHYPAQLRSGAGLEAELARGPIGQTEAHLAGELIDAYSGPPRWADYRDDSAEALAALVEARLQGQTPAESAPQSVPALLDALRQSIAALHPGPGAEAAGSQEQNKAPRRSCR